MSFMNSMQEKMEATLVPLAAKINGQRHVAAVRDAFTLAFPMTLAGSIIVLINYAIFITRWIYSEIITFRGNFPSFSRLSSIIISGF